MSAIVVDIVARLDDGWFINADGRTPQQIKDTYLGKSVTDGDVSYIVDGIEFAPKPFDWAHGDGYLVELRFR